LILDTNALSAVADGDAAAVVLFKRSSSVAIPVIVLGEYRYGIALSHRRQEYERWLARALASCFVLEINEGTSAEYAAIRLELRRAGTLIPMNDIWIAALCRQHALPILTRDAHFDVVSGVQRLSW